MPIRRHESIFQTDQSTFEPAALVAMSQAFEQACIALGIVGHDRNGREAVATRIIDLARTGVIETTVLRDRVLLESRAVA